MRLPLIGSVQRLWRYYQAGIVNTLFGYGLYALMVKLGLNMYVAQLAAHLLGIVFNYFTYSRHTFHDAQGSKWRFVVSYGFNYVMSVAALAAASLIFKSPYAAGFASILIVSLLNFFVLKHFVFIKKAAA